MSTLLKKSGGLVGVIGYGGILSAALVVMVVTLGPLTQFAA